MNQNRVDRHANDNEKTLERQRKQGFQVVIAELPPFPVRHRRQRDRRDCHREVDLDHAPEDDDENDDGQDLQT